MAELDSTIKGADASIPAGPGVPGKGKSFLLLGIIGVLVIVLAGGSYTWWTGDQKKKQADESTPEAVEKRMLKQLESKKSNKAPVFINSMDEFLVNLPGKGGEHYLQTKLVLQVGDAATEKRIVEFLPLVRDRMLSVLSSRSVSELATVEGKAALAKDLALVINSIIEPQLTAIYVLQQDPSTADLRNLERLGAIPKQADGASYSTVAKEAAAQFWRVTEMDLPVQAVLFSALVMQ
jgi:flagellar FliL protein